MLLFGLICWGNWEHPANEAEGGHLEGLERMCSWHVETLVYLTMHCSKQRGCIMRVSFSRVDQPSYQPSAGAWD